ncbi:hypothetical protein C8N35_110120 [Breoghania corrubedonensis]|uniref:Peptidase YpeB-like protein n=1 Tax=Breoghania corrubedonensis TaxID=665038 RepID=A0A2T5V1J8_9HYPH|nr:PepSY domain-containing protein [Breoghania corrubedonensis]PTW57641.1 hypothetical protein C8N35_110120 [Breoghania corrubedonensis]
MSVISVPTLPGRLVLATCALLCAALLALPVVAQPPPPGGGRPGMPSMGRHHCLGPGEMRQAVGAGQALPLGSIMSAIGGGQIVRAILCETPRGLIYRVAVLKDARVDELIIDARTGKILRRR